MKTKTIDELKAMVAEAPSQAALLKELSAGRFADDGDEELAGLAYDAMSKYQELRRDADRVIGRAMNVIELMERPSLDYIGLSSGGELQGLGTALDVDTARYYDAFARLAGAVNERARTEMKIRHARAEDSLAVSDRAVYVLLSSGDMTVRQLAKELGWSVGEVEVTVDALVREHLASRVRNYVRKNTLDQWDREVAASQSTAQEVRP